MNMLELLRSSGWKDWGPAVQTLATVSHRLTSLCCEANAEIIPPASSGMYMTLFKGVTLGFFAPFLPLFFFRSENSIFSSRMQMAIVAGMSINILYGALRSFV